MPASLEHIKKEIRELAPTDVETLLRDLQDEYVMPAPSDTEEASIEAEWDAEIARRVKEVEDGTVELISGEEFNRHIDQLFAQRGLTRTRRA